MEQLSEIPMTKVALKYDYVEAVEVTAKYVYSLPNAGAVLQRFGEQVEILHPGPVKKKVYAQIGEYIVTYKDANGNQEYIVISPAAYRGLFQDYAPSEVQTDIRDVTTPPDIKAPALEETDGQQDPSSEPPPSASTDAPPVVEKPLTEAEKKAKEKEEAKRKRMQELQEVDIDGLEKGLDDGPTKE